MDTMIEVVTKHGDPEKIRNLKRMFSEISQEININLIHASRERPLTDSEQKFINHSYNIVTKKRRLISDISSLSDKISFLNIAR